MSMYGDETKDAPARDQTLVVRAGGELWKYEKKYEQFKLVLREVYAQIVDFQDQYAARFEVLKKSGQVLFGESVTNNLRMQYNKAHHSMVWTLWDPQRNKVNVLSFIFQRPDEEHQFKMAMAIKLFENNRQESFERVMKRENLKEADRDWVGESLEVAPEGADDYVETDDLVLADDVVAQDCTPMDLDESDDEEEDEDDPDFLHREATKTKTKGTRIRPSAAARVPEEERGSPYRDIQADPFAGQPRPGQTNTHIQGSKCFNRSYVVRETPRGAMLGLYKHDDDNELAYLGKLSLKDTAGHGFTPEKVQQHDENRRMLFLSEEHPGTVHVMDLERGKVVEEWQTKPEDEGGLRDINPTTKNGDMTGDPLVYGVNSKSMFLLDGRLPDKVVDDGFVYKTNPAMNALRTTGSGLFATSSDTGQLRLYNKLGMRAKTLLPGLGDAIKDLDVTDDGRWLLATCKDYLMLVPTTVPGTDRLGYEGRGMGKQKPRPYVLRLRPQDMAAHNLRDVDFTAARFDLGDGVDEHWIVTSTGPFIVKWNLRKIKKSGITTACSIRRAHGKVVASEFRFNRGDDLLVSEQDSVYAQHSTRKGRR